MLASLLVGLMLAQTQAATPAPDGNPMALSPEIQAFLDQKVDRGLADKERLEALVQAVFQDESLKFTYAPETRTAIETFTNRGGNCLSFTILFIAIARHVGLDARFREVEIAPAWSKNGMFVSLNKHVNAAVFIGGMGYAIDVFPGVNRIEIGGQIVPDARGLAHFYNNIGADELGKGNLTVAEAYLRKALEMDPKAVSVWINLGVTKGQAGELREAESCYRKALQLDSRELVAMSNLAGLCQRTGRSREALRYMTKVREFQEKNPYHHYNLGLQAFEAGNYQVSIAEYKKALKLKSKEHNFYFALARAYAKLDQLEDAMTSLQLASKYAPDSSNQNRYNQKLELLKASQNPS